MNKMMKAVLAAALLVLAPQAIAAEVGGYVSPAYFAADEAAGELPPVGERLPENPAI